MRETSPPSGAQWEIEADGHRAVVVAVGGGLRSYTVRGVEIVDGYALDALCPGAAGQILAPWPNRVRDGRYAFAGESYQLALTEPATHNAIHGLTRWLRWYAVDSSSSSVTVECDLSAQTGYPWTLRLATTWSVGPDGLTVAHEVTNLSATPCPFGLGAHPYPRIDGTAVDDLILTLPARQRLLTDARGLPMGAARVAAGPFDFTEPRRIGDSVLDTAFSDVVRDERGISTARLATIDGSQVREVWADEAFGWWQAFTGDTLHGERRRRSVALEPMTCPPDAYRSGRDVVTVEPGGQWRGTWGIRSIVGG